MSSLPSFGLSSLAGKRDSFGKLLTPASSIKDQLHTLMEEEEEEEDEGTQYLSDDKFNAVSTPIRKPVEQAAETSFGDSDADMSMLTPNAHANSSNGSDAPELSLTTPSPVPVRHRPANLTLRPLALSPSVPTLPTPAFTPSPRPGLRPLSLTPSPDTSVVCSTLDSSDLDRVGSFRRQNSVVRSPSPSSPSTSQRRQMSSGSMSSMGASAMTKRQSSISYFRSVNSQSPATMFSAACLPTPGATPTSERRQSSSSSSDTDSMMSRDRRTASEEIFIHQSHASLLARITELERALHSRPRSRPTSMQSNASVASSEPPDEMLQLVADLKAERDELNRDINGWRQRVKDLEHVKTVLTGRLEKERQDNWYKGEQLGILKVENNSIVGQLKERDQEVASVSQKLEQSQAQLRQAIQERDSVKEDLDAVKRQLTDCLASKSDVEVQLASLHTALATERAYREQLMRQLDSIGVLKTPGTASEAVTTKRMIFNVQQHGNGLGFRSIDSACTTVESDEGQEPWKAPFTLKAVEEEIETSEDQMSDQDDELARYEEEDDSDLSMSLSNSSFDDDMPRSVSHLRLDASTPNSQSYTPGRSVSASPSPSPSPCPTPVPLLSQAVEVRNHAKNASLSRAWTFPSGQTPSPRRDTEEVDRFFGCLEDFDDNSPTSDSGLNVAMDRQSLFSRGLQVNDEEEDDEMPPFVLPTQEISERKGMLDVVMEEEEEEDIQGVEVEGGVKFTFPTSVSDESLNCVSPPPMFDHSSEEESAVPFTFPQARTHPISVSHTSSAIPSAPPVTPVKVPFPRTSAFSTPSNKTTSGMRALPPSRIPPPSPLKFSQPKPKPAQPVPPPKRKPVPVVTFSPAPKVSSSLKKFDRAPSQPPTKLGKGISAAKTPSFIPQFKSPSELYLSLTASNNLIHRSPDPSSTTLTPNLSDEAYPASAIYSNEPSTLSSRLSFQAFTHFMPSLLWVPRGASNVRNETAKVPRPPVYVAREKQLAKLRDRLVSEQIDAYDPLSSSAQIEKCNKCQSGLISL